MVDTCTVTWTARDFSFVVAAGTRLVFMPVENLALAGAAGTLYVPGRVEVTSDGSGAGSAALVPATYTLSVITASGIATATLAVPDLATATIGYCIDNVMLAPTIGDVQALVSEAEAAAISANAALDSFDDRYLGSKSANPVLDNDGAALLTGALYFNTVTSEMRVYTGVAWVAAYVNDSTYVPLAGGAMTGALAVPAGSAGAPSISISGDTDTGIWSPGANALAISTGATERLRIDASGNVFIGNSDAGAGARLTVTGRAGLTVTDKNSHVWTTINSTADTANFNIRAAQTKNASIGFTEINVADRWAVGIKGGNGSLVFGSGTSDIGTATERLRIDASGNVGIGTSSPAAKLVVNSASALASVPAVGSKAGLFVATVGAQDYGLVSGALFDGSYFFQSQTTNGTSATYPILLNPNGGNVGIGTSSPSALLHLGGANNKSVRLDTALGNAAFLAGWENTAQFGVNRNPATGVVTDSGKAAAGVRMVGEAGNSYVTVETTSTNNAAPTERLRIDASGNVGIGTTPAVRLHSYEFFGGTVARLQTGTTANGNFLDFYNASSARQGLVGFIDSANLYVHNDAAAAIIFDTNATERLRIDAAGNVGIGTSSPQVRLDVKGDAYVSGTLFPDSISSYSGDLPINVAGNSFIVNAGATERLRVDASGNLLVGTTAYPTSVGTSGVGIRNVSGIIGQIAIGKTSSGASDVQTFYHNGTYVGGIQISETTTTFLTSSDYRLKEDLQPIADASLRLAALNPVNFAWKADGTRTDGFIAHEAQAVAPQAVTGEKDGEAMQAIDHSKLVPLLTAALQEALAKIALLETRISALEA